MEKTQVERGAPRAALLAITVALGLGSIAGGCARLPETTKTVHEEEAVVVTLEREAKSRDYTHPIQITSTELASILRGFSIREQQRLPLRWFAEEAPPKPLLREDQLRALSPYLSDALQKAGTNERVHFQARMPQLTKYDRDVIEGWLAVRDPYFYLTIEQFMVPIPIRTSDLYYRNYPTAPPPPRDYILYFEPGRFWTADQKGDHAVEFRQFLRSGEAGPAKAPQPPPAGAP